jgi:hypothetical protein
MIQKLNLTLQKTSVVGEVIKDVVIQIRVVLVQVPVVPVVLRVVLDPVPILVLVLDPDLAVPPHHPVLQLLTLLPP